MNEAFVAFWSTLILICRTSRITLCGKSCDLERKYVVFATPVPQKRRRRPIYFSLDSLSAQMNVPNTKFSRKTMKHLNHNASTLRTHVTFQFVNITVWHMRMQTIILIYNYNTSCMYSYRSHRIFHWAVFSFISQLPYKSNF